MNEGFLIIDIQVDFLEGGSVPARSTQTLIRDLQVAIDAAEAAAVHCIFTSDWHPWNHRSFVSHGGKWPVHCVQGSHGAEFPSDLRRPQSSIVVKKGTSPAILGYSAFEGTDLMDIILANGIKKLAVCGLTTEYCVKFSVLDAIACGLQVSVLTDLVRTVGKPSADDFHALSTMRDAGAQLCTSVEWISQLRSENFRET